MREAGSRGRNHAERTAGGGSRTRARHSSRGSDRESGSAGRRRRELGIPPDRTAVGEFLRQSAPARRCRATSCLDVPTKPTPQRRAHGRGVDPRVQVMIETELLNIHLCALQDNGLGTTVHRQPHAGRAPTSQQHERTRRPPPSCDCHSARAGAGPSAGPVIAGRPAQQRRRDEHRCPMRLAAETPRHHHSHGDRSPCSQRHTRARFDGVAKVWRIEQAAHPIRALGGDHAALTRSRRTA